jgi:hypothetical protein
MVKSITYKPHLFEGGAGAAAASAAASTGADAAGQQVEMSGGAGASKSSTILYGKQAAEDAHTSIITSSDTADDRKAAYQAARQEYKAEIDGEIQHAIQKRYKDYKTMQAERDSSRALMQMIASKYGVDDASDAAALMDAINADDSFYEDAAMREGLTVSQYKEMERLKRDNAAMQAAQQQDQQQRYKAAKTAEWMQQADAVKAKWPSFDFESELQDPEFGKLLQSGISVEHAFVVLHQDELMQSAMAATANNVAAQTAANIAARGQRPRENGATSGGAAVIKSDVSKLTRADRKEIARRVRMGENISF